MSGRQTWLLVFVVLVSAWMQAALSYRIAILHSSPNFILVILICISLIVGTVNAALINVWGGFLMCVLAGLNYGSILVSRVATGSIVGLLRQHVIEDSPFVPPITVFLATWLCEGLYFVMAPNVHSLHWWIRNVFGESLYNSVICLPVYFGLRLMGVKNEVDGTDNPFYDLQ